MGTQNFDKWLDTFLSEKGVDLEFMFVVEGSEFGTNFIPVGAVVEFLKGSSAENKEIVKKQLVMIDYKNGDVYHFLDYVAKYMAKNYG